MYSQTIFAAVCNDAIGLVYAVVAVPWVLVIILSLISLLFLNWAEFYAKLKSSYWLGPLVVASLVAASVSFNYDNQLSHVLLIIVIPAEFIALLKYLSDIRLKDDQKLAKVFKSIFIINIAYLVLAVSIFSYASYELLTCA